MCGEQDEYVCHIFTLLIIMCGNLVNLDQCFSSSSPASWIESALSSFSRSEFNLFAVILSNLWFNINQLAHGETSVSSDHLIAQSMKLVDDIFSAQVIAQRYSGNVYPSPRLAPSGSFDGICRECHCVGFGAVIHNSEGSFLVGFAKQAPFLSDPLIAEAVALRCAVSQA